MYLLLLSVHAHTSTQVLLKGIFEATEVQTPTTFIILNKKLPPEAELTNDLEAVKDLFEQGMTWLERLQTVGEGIIEGDADKVLGKIKEVLDKHMTDKTMYFYLVDELTGKAILGDGYPIVIKTPSELVHKLLPVMQWACAPCRSITASGVSRAGSACLFRRVLSEDVRKLAQASVEMLKQARL